MTADELSVLTATVARIDERTENMEKSMTAIDKKLEGKITQYDEDIGTLRVCAKENKTNIGWIIKIGSGLLGGISITGIILKALKVY
jgi:hypothetical protein